MVRSRTGDVIQVRLPTGEYAYGRVLRDACVALYRQRSTGPNCPPIGSRDVEFTVGVYEDVLAKWPVAGQDPSATPEEDWPPPYSAHDLVSGQFRVYHKGEMRASTKAECEGLEPAAVWDEHHLIDRLTGRKSSN